MSMPDIYKLAFSSIKSISIDDADRLLNLVGSERELFELSEADMASIMGRNHKLISRGERNHLLAEAEDEARALEGRNISFVYFRDERYPEIMRHAYDAPLRLFVAGECDLNSPHRLAVVGTRHSTAYGQAFINSLIADLASVLPDLIIISGGAYGSDITAHRAALANHLPTVVVMAHGLNTIYPASHRSDIANIINNGGAVVTEYTLDTPPLRGHFLARNRIVSAMSDAIVVVESGLKGGSMVTARIACEQSRQVFALPGRVTDKYSLGCNRLIETDCARLLSSAETILTEMGWADRNEGIQTLLPGDNKPAIDPNQQSVIDLIRTEGGTIPIARLANLLSKSPAETMSMVIELEFNGYMTILPGSKVMLI